MIKLTKRKGFNFFRSYFDVYNELETDADKVAFIDALLDRQFMGIKPTQLTGMAKFAYISQTNSIDSQVKGFEDKTGIILYPCLPPTVGGVIPPSLQVEVKEKVKVKEKYKDVLFSKETKLNLTERETNFKNECRIYLNEFGKELLLSFFNYWSEPNHAKTKMRFELEKTFDIKRRLKTWQSNSTKFETKTNKPNTPMI